MITLVDNNKSISYKSIADIVVTQIQIDGLRRYTDQMRILDIKLSNFKITYFEFKPVDIFIEIETDDYTNEKFINRFILNNKYASTDLFKSRTIDMIHSETLLKIYESERLKTCLNFNISDKGFEYVADKIKEITNNLDRYNKENKKDI